MAKATKKQKITNNRFNISNIAEASGNKETFKSKKIKEKLVPIKFKVHNDLIESFQFLRVDYAKKQKKFSLSHNVMFTIMVNFVDASFKKEKKLLNCPEDFKKAMIKPGKRKATKRTFPSDQTKEILFTVPLSIADKYMDIMFSYIMNYSNDGILDSHHSRTYFFYDFINYLKSNKKELLKYIIEE